MVANQLRMSSESAASITYSILLSAFSTNVFSRFGISNAVVSRASDIKKQKTPLRGYRNKRKSSRLLSFQILRFDWWEDVCGCLPFWHSAVNKILTNIRPLFWPAPIYIFPISVIRMVGQDFLAWAQLLRPFCGTPPLCSIIWLWFDDWLHCPTTLPRPNAVYEKMPATTQNSKKLGARPQFTKWRRQNKSHIRMRGREKENEKYTREKKRKSQH